MTTLPTTRPPKPTLQKPGDCVTHIWRHPRYEQVGFSVTYLMTIKGVQKECYRGIVWVGDDMNEYLLQCSEMLSSGKKVLELPYSIETPWDDSEGIAREWSARTPSNQPVKGAKTEAVVPDGDEDLMEGL